MSLKSILKEKQITQEELAKALRVSQSAVSLWVTNKCLPKTRRLKEIAKVCGCTVEELITSKK